LLFLTGTICVTGSGQGGGTAKMCHSGQQTPPPFAYHALHDKI